MKENEDFDFEDEKKLVPKKEIDELEKGSGFDPALEAGVGIIQKPLNILVLDGSGSSLTKSVSNAILGNELLLEESKKFPNEKVFCNSPVQGFGGAQITRLLCDKVSSVEKGNSFEKLCEGNFKVEDYDVIVVVGLNPNSDKGVLDFIANKIKNGQDDNLIVYSTNFLSDNESMEGVKYYLPYEYGHRNLLKKIALFDKKSKKFVGWDLQDIGEVVPVDNINKNDFNPKASGASKIFKDHYGKIATGVLLLEEIFLGKIRKNLPKLFKSKEIKNKNNKDNKDVKDDKSLNNDAKKEKTL